MADIAEPLARINAVLTRAEKDIADVFYEAIQQLKNDLDLNELARLLENADFDAAYRLVQNAAERTAQAVNVAFINSGISTGLFLERAGLIRVGFDQVNQRAVNAMANNSLRMIADFSEKQRDAARVAMTRGIREGAGPIEQARNFREVVGLTGQLRKRRKCLLRQDSNLRLANRDCAFPVAGRRQAFELDSQECGGRDAVRARLLQHCQCDVWLSK